MHCGCQVLNTPNWWWGYKVHRESAAGALGHQNFDLKMSNNARWTFPKSKKSLNKAECIHSVMLVKVTAIVTLSLNHKSLKIWFMLHYFKLILTLQVGNTTLQRDKSLWWLFAKSFHINVPLQKPLDLLSKRSQWSQILFQLYQLNQPSITGASKPWLIFHHPLR